MESLFYSVAALLVAIWLVFMLPLYPLVVAINWLAMGYSLRQAHSEYWNRWHEIRRTCARPLAISNADVTG